MYKLGIRVVGRSGQGFSISCPEYWNHEGGVDRNPSAMLYPSKDGYFNYKCFACGAYGHVRGLAWKIFERTGIGDDELMFLVHAVDVEKMMEKKERSYGSDNNFNRTQYDYSPGGVLKKAQFKKNMEDVLESTPNMKKKKKKQDKMTFKTISSSYIKRLQEAPMPDFFLERGYTRETYKTWGLGNDIRDRRLIFFVYDRMGHPLGKTGRLYWDKDFCFACGRSLIDEDGRTIKQCQCGKRYSKYIHSWGSWRRYVLFGIHKYRDGDPLIVTEGTFDTIKLYQHGLRCPVSILGNKPHEHQFSLMANVTDNIYLMGDGDEGGRDFHKYALEKFKNYDITPKIIEIPDGEDPDSLSKDQLNDVLPEELRVQLIAD